MWNRSSCFLVLLVAATALIFPPPRVERFSPGHLLLPNPCSLFHFHSEHPLIQGGYYFNKIVHRLNRQVPCPRHLVFNKEQHIKLEATEVRTLEAEAY